MAAGRKGVGFLGAGVFALLAAVGLAVWGIVPIFTQFKQLAVVESPADVEFTIERPGTYTLWHDYRTLYNGKATSRPKTLPSGLHATLVRQGDGKAFAMTPVRVSETMSMSGNESEAVGRFKVDRAGRYRLTVQFPTSQQRIFSIREGSTLGSMGKFGLRFALAMLAGTVAFVLIILGIVFMVMKPKAMAGPPPPPA